MKRPPPTSGSQTVGAIAGVAYLRSGAAVVFSVLVVRIYGSEARGLVALVQALCATSLLVGDLGISTALRRFVTDRTEAVYSPNYFRIAAVLVPGVAAVVLALFLLLVPSRPGGALLIGAVVVAGLGEGYTRIQLAYLNAIGDHTAAQSHQLAQAILAIVCSLGFVGFFGTSPVVAVAAYSTGTLASAMISGNRTMDVVRRSPISVKHSRELTRFGVQAVPAVATTGLISRFDQILVGSIGGSQMLGRYAVAVSIAEAVRPRTQAVSQLVYRAAAENFNAGVRLRNKLLRPMVLFQLVATPCLLAASIFVAPAVFGNEIGKIWPTVAVLLVAELAFLLYLVDLRILLAAGRVTRAGCVGAIGVLLLAGFNALLISKFGLIGAALASGVAYLSIGVLARAFVRMDSRNAE